MRATNSYTYTSYLHLTPNFSTFQLQNIPLTPPLPFGIIFSQFLMWRGGCRATTNGEHPPTPMTDSELKSKCYTILAEQVGNVEMERFIMLVSRDTFDYTEWRKNNLFVGETVDSLCDKIEQFQAQSKTGTIAQASV